MPLKSGVLDSMGVVMAIVQTIILAWLTGAAIASVDNLGITENK